jgi:hypothetical protein
MLATALRAHAREIGKDVVAILRTARLPVNTEAELQTEVAALLTRNGIIHAREVKVAGGRIDFLVGYVGRFSEQPSVGLEIKIKGGKRAIHRQCAAYCGDPRISELVVLTGISLGLPPTMNGKRVTIVSIGGAWL